MEPLRIAVTAGSGRYDVVIADGLAKRLPSLLKEASIDARTFIVSSPNVWQLHGRDLARRVPDMEPILVPDGERFKHLQTVSRIYEALIRAGADRSSAVLALGGGVIGDVAGFAAATFLRGIPLVQIPTTLMAQVDAAVGGKVGVNHPLGKNMIGAFYPPRLVLVDPSLLASLPRREFRAGLYEVVKYGMTSSGPLFDRLRRDLQPVFARDLTALVPIVAECCTIKAAIVSADEREAGLRRVLNFGHTAGHAFETLTRYRRFRHGEAVAYGMLVAAEVAVARGALLAGERDALAALIRHLGPLPQVADLSARQAVEIIHRDKKVLRGRLHYVLPTGIGSWTIVDDVEDRELEAALKKTGLRR